MMGFMDDPNDLPIKAVPAYHPNLGYWVVQFTFGGPLAFWQVDFTEQTDESPDGLRIHDMRQHAINLFTEEVARRLAL